jgi:hypothetical protein
MDIAKFPTLIKFKSILPVLVLFLVVSCQEWTPQADGYFMIDNKRYPVHVMVVYTDTFNDQGGKYFPEITLQGAPYCNVSMHVISPTRTVPAGKYEMTRDYNLMDITSVGISFGKSNNLSTDYLSTGTMTVEVSGDHYNLDFKGVFQRRNVEIHYSGLTAQDAL